MKSFIKLGPLLLQQQGVKYLPSELFNQDPLKKYMLCIFHGRGIVVEVWTTQQWKSSKRA